MIKENVLSAYREKYKAFPDLVERIISQFDWEYWKYGNPNCIISIEYFTTWRFTKEEHSFWGRLADAEDIIPLTRESIDAAYAEFQIEHLADNNKIATSQSQEYQQTD